MKISPVSGVPTIEQPHSSGVSPEKLERLKTIARGEKPQELAAEEREKVRLGDVTPNSTRSIKMNVNRTPKQSLAQAIVDAQPGGDGPVPTEPNASEPVISDTGVQSPQETEDEAISPRVESTQQISPQLAALAKRERALQVKEREIADKQKSSEERNQKFSSLEEQAQNGSLLGVLEALGVPKDKIYSRLTDEVLGNQSTAPVDALTKKIETLEKSIDERLAKKDSEQEQAVFTHMSKNIGILARTRPEFRFLKESNSEGKVLTMIKKSWFGDGSEEFPGGIVLDEEDACQAIETELRENAKRYSKILGELETKAPAPVEQTEQPARFRTLTNKDSARPVMSRRQRAIAAALGQK